jgi:hypothetical protein
MMGERNERQRELSGRVKIKGKEGRVVEVGSKFQKGGRKEGEGKEIEQQGQHKADRIYRGERPGKGGASRELLLAPSGPSFGQCVSPVTDVSH